ncbi:MAG: hypothetical protein JW932_06965 [Deltaproteobacteria bacterium]|nr:hypothetical protein [Deltaproteobacteria bacterium]
MTNDMGLIVATLRQSLTCVVTSFVMVFGILIMVLSICVIMTLIALFTLPAGMIY